VFPSDSPTAYTDLANEVDRLNAEHERLKDERDAAVARNIHLHTRVEEERALRVPVADIVLGVLRILDTAKTVDDVRAAVEDIPGWDGTEGGYYPGCQTSHFIARDVYDKDLAALRAEVVRLNTKDAALAAEVLDLRAKLSQMADDAVKVMAKSLRDVEEMRAHLASKDVHCPGTDSDCPRACTTNLCETMVEQLKLRHGCG
jgi:predicted nuclease with TOPRIM domain